MAKGRKGGHRHFTDAETLERERQGMDRRRGADDDDEEEEDDEGDGGRGKRTGNKMNAQSNTVGMLPPNSDEEEEDEPPKPKGKPARKVQPGDLPPSGSDDSESDDDDDSDSGSDAAPPAPPPKRELTRREREALEAQHAKPDPEQVAADMERLRLAREKRAQQAAARIASEGFDRYAPPPGTAPAPNPLAPEGEAAAPKE